MGPATNRNLESRTLIKGFEIRDLISIIRAPQPQTATIKYQVL